MVMGNNALALIYIAQVKHIEGRSDIYVCVTSGCTESDGVKTRFFRLSMAKEHVEITGHDVRRACDAKRI